MDVELRALQLPQELEPLHVMLTELGWGQRIGDLSKLAAMIKGSQRHVGAFHGPRLVGFARALCDGVSNGYLSLVAVDPAYRRQGLGRRMIQHLMGDDPGITWVLRAGRGSTDFWRKLGFSVSEIAMERCRA